MVITSYEDFQLIFRNNYMYTSNSVPKMICSTQPPLTMCSHGLHCIRTSRCISPRCTCYDILRWPSASDMPNTNCHIDHIKLLADSKRNILCCWEWWMPQHWRHSEGRVHYADLTHQIASRHIKTLCIIQWRSRASLVHFGLRNHVASAYIALGTSERTSNSWSEEWRHKPIDVVCTKCDARSTCIFSLYKDHVQPSATTQQTTDTSVPILKKGRQ